MRIISSDVPLLLQFIYIHRMRRLLHVGGLCAIFPLFILRQLKVLKKDSALCVLMLAS